MPDARRAARLVRLRPDAAAAAAAGTYVSRFDYQTRRRSSTRSIRKSWLLPKFAAMADAMPSHESSTVSTPRHGVSKPYY